jgi:hypothetical protein
MKILDIYHLGITLTPNLFVISVVMDIILKLSGFHCPSGMGRLKIRVRPGPALEGKNHD